MTKPRFRGAVFDLDGTLIDTGPLALDAETRTLAAFGVDPDDSRRPRVFGMTDEAGMRLMADVFGLDYPALLRAYLRQYESNLQVGVTLMPGVRQLLDWLRGRGVPLALVTSGDRRYVSLIDSSLKLSDNFSAVVTLDDVQRPKPDPDPYLRALRELGLASSAAIGFEDSGPGIQSLAAAGIYAVAVHKDGDQRPELQMAAERLNGFDQLLAGKLTDWF